MTHFYSLFRQKRSQILRLNRWTVAVQIAVIFGFVIFSAFFLESPLALVLSAAFILGAGLGLISRFRSVRPSYYRVAIVSSGAAGTLLDLAKPNKRFKIPLNQISFALSFTSGSPKRDHDGLVVIAHKRFYFSLVKRDQNPTETLQTLGVKVFKLSVAHRVGAVAVLFGLINARLFDLDYFESFLILTSGLAFLFWAYHFFVPNPHLSQGKIISARRLQPMLRQRFAGFSLIAFAVLIGTFGMAISNRYSKTWEDMAAAANRGDITTELKLSKQLIKLAPTEENINRFVWKQITQPDPAARDYKSAVKVMKWVDDPQFQSSYGYAHDTFACALMGAGQKAEALAHAKAHRLKDRIPLFRQDRLCETRKTDRLDPVPVSENLIADCESKKDAEACKAAADLLTRLGMKDRAIQLAQYSCDELEAPLSCEQVAKIQGRDSQSADRKVSSDSGNEI